MSGGKPFLKINFIVDRYMSLMMIDRNKIMQTLTKIESGKPLAGKGCGWFVC